MGKKKDNTPKTDDKATELASELGLDASEVQPTEEVKEATTEAPESTEEVIEDTVQETKEDKGKEIDPNAFFRKMKPTIFPEEKSTKTRVKVKYKERQKQIDQGISANPSLIVFPTDRFGVTKDVKKALLHAASRIAGDEKKKELVLEVIEICKEHLELKFKEDRAYRKKLAERDAAKRKEANAENN